MNVTAPRCLLLATLLLSPVVLAAQCPPAPDGAKRLLWGDLHVHTAWSLDAYAFGAMATPTDAYRFARGEALTLMSGDEVRIDRPLDFAAVTDHAETFDLMHACTDPGASDDAYCRSLRAEREAQNARRIFNDFLLPIVSLTPPAVPGVCKTVDCPAARINQWQRAQAAANAADAPCEFSALIGYEWTASPGGRHWHRNVIYRSQNVPDQAFDYVRYPEVGQLWAKLEETCRPEDGCDVLTIPHNINWADGGTFDLTSEPAATTRLRAHYERLAEVHQEKGSSECLPVAPGDTSEDCRFERVLDNTAKLRMSGADPDPVAAWRNARKSYYRTLLGAGLDRGAANPFMLGAIGSTDTHFGTPGMVAEVDYFGGIALLLATDAARLSRTAFNPGGLVAVWAQENTRSSIFDALQRREAYATSGPRIKLRFAEGNLCSADAPEPSTLMGGVYRGTTAPVFSVQVARDHAPLAAVDVVKGAFNNGELTETVTRIAEFPAGRDAVCVSHQDATFVAAAPAYWYVRVLEAPSKRWSKHLCERLGQCEAHPEADRMIQERAWSSPIWYQGTGGR